MYLSDRDLEFAIRTGQLIVDPPPTEYDTTSIDLHLDRIEEAKVWDVEAFERQQRQSGIDPAVVRVGRFDHRAFSAQFHKVVPDDETQLVYRTGAMVVVKLRGFFLWQTREKLGTPEIDPRLICFIEGRSTSARTGLVIHMTAPTIHAGWWGQVTLEISNLGPFNIGLKAGDAVAQVVVATISSPPRGRKNVKGVAIGQKDVGGQAAPPS
jgi:dCTP deaminase